MPVSVSVRRKTSKGKKGKLSKKSNKSNKNKRSSKSKRSRKMYGGQEFVQVTNEELKLEDKTTYYTKNNGNGYTIIGKYKGPGLNNELVFLKSTLISLHKIIPSDTPIYKKVE